MGRINDLFRRLPSWAVWALGLLPLLWVIWLVQSNGLGVDPVKELEHRFGKIGLWFLIGGLAITPARRFLGLNLIRHRRAIGLLAFLYIVLHLLVWITLDMGLLWQQAAQDVIKRPYLLFGMASLLLMLPLALTSNTASIRAMGRNWQRLHRLVYPAVLLAVIHYLWQMKVVSAEGYLWLGVAALLLLARLSSRILPRKGGIAPQNRR